MRKNVLAGLVLMTIAGCSDPAASRMTSGIEAVLFRENEEYVPTETKTSGPLLEPMGTRVVVIQDSVSGDPGSSERMVKVTMKDGAEKGETVTVQRQFLRAK